MKFLRLCLAALFIGLCVAPPTPASAYTVNTSSTFALTGCAANGSTNGTLSAPSGWRGRWLVTAAGETTYLCEAASCAANGLPLAVGSYIELDYTGSVSCRSSGATGALTFVAVTR